MHHDCGATGLPLAQRATIISLIDTARAAGARLAKACALLGLSLRTVQRWRQGDGELRADGRTERHWQPPNKLTETERAKVLSTANCAEFANLIPTQIVPILAERGEYVACESTFYRLLSEADQLAHRHASRAPKERRAPKALRATAPNQIYTWDITYLPTAVKGQFFYLYLFMDLFSRKIVGWQVHDFECNEAAANIVLDIAQREGIDPQQLTLHSDNGGPMKGATMLATLQRLGIVPSFSRPQVSNDNPFSESLFKTLKYHHSYPSQPFANLDDARHWVEGFVHWYNHTHRHSAIKFVTPAQRHSGQDQAILAKRHAVYIEPKDATHNAGADAHETGRTYTKFISILKKQPNHKARLWH